MIDKNKKVLTIVSKNSDKKLHTKIHLIFLDYLNSLNVGLVKKNYLNKYKAVDFIFLDKNDLVTNNSLSRRLRDYPVDYCLQKLSARKKKLFLTDMDGTIINNETLNDIARFLGKGEEVKKITDLGINGRLDFSTSLDNRVEVLKGLKINSLEEAKKNVVFIEGASKLISTLKKNNIYTVLVSGGFKPITTYVKKTLKINEELSNNFGISGDVFNGKVEGKIVNASYKKIILNKFQKKLNLKKNETISLGDAANDLNMLLSSGLSIAYKATDVVKANIDNQINHTNLLSVLYFLGIK